MDINAFIFNESTFEFQVLDQTLLPNEKKFVKIDTVQDGYDSIKNMLVRGAPCIAAVGCLSLITELNKFKSFDLTSDLIQWLELKAEYLILSRPTAVNLKHALEKLVAIAKANSNSDPQTMMRKLTSVCCRALREGEEANRRLGDFGAQEILAHQDVDGVSILTHCNTGALATVGHGTALGIVRSLHMMDKLKRVFCTETRPYNQGSRLTAWELVQEKIPSTLIADNMVSYLMETHKIDAVIVGADRVAANGDTANKIGTLQIAVLAKHYNVPFYVAAPTQTIDLSTKDAKSIVIEQRNPDELRKLAGVQLAPGEIDVWNPCFDITPSNLINGIITEFGVCTCQELIHFMESIELDDDDLLF